jgi:hypothetical protein
MEEEEEERRAMIGDFFRMKVVLSTNENDVREMRRSSVWK